MTFAKLVMPIGGRRPLVDAEAFVAPTAVVLGSVVIGAGASVWYHAVLRGDTEEIVIGAGSNIQDNCTVHADPGCPALIGERVTVGHNAVLHGCVLEDEVLVGMGATVLNRARIGAGSLIAAGAVVPEGMTVPPGSLVAGLPATVKRPLSAGWQEIIRWNAAEYGKHAALHADAFRLLG